MVSKDQKHAKERKEELEENNLSDDVGFLVQKSETYSWEREHYQLL